MSGRRRFRAIGSRRNRASPGAAGPYTPAAPPSERGSCAASISPLGERTSAPAWPNRSRSAALVRSIAWPARASAAAIDVVVAVLELDASRPARPRRGRRNGAARRARRRALAPAAMRVNDLRLELRLAVAAHRAVGEDAAVVEHGERRVERMERPPPRHQRIARLRIEREGDAAVLHQHAGARQHAARAVFPDRPTG